jgi:16S rRNA (uracil1498-N3)-methyltransferase
LQPALSYFSREKEISKVSLRAFYCERIPPPDENAALPESELKHLFKVLRAKCGDEIILLDGQGKSARALVNDKKNIVILRSENHPFRRLTLKLFVSPPRHSGMDTILSFCAETAVSEIIPIICENSIAVPRESGEKWKRKIIESCKQAKNPFFPLIHDSVDFDGALQMAKDTDAFYGDPYEPAAISSPLKKNKASWFAGPEGGFSLKEIEMMKAMSFFPLNLSPVIMRTETAALAGIIWLSN